MSDEPEAPKDKTVVKYGFLVRTADFRTIKIITIFLTILLITDILLSLKFFISAIQIRSHLGYFINMISSGDGDILPSLQAVPVLFCLITNLGMALMLYMSFDQMERSGLNRLMFVLAFTGLVLLFVVFIIIIVVIAHAYSAHESLHDGIVTAMNNYSTSILYKSQIDRLQIEFQCCGSKKYDEWYTLNWRDKSLEKDGGGSAADGNTPFSCCSMKSLFPCIHHGIEITGKAYLYTPEFNLSISTRGCYDILREKKQQIGWLIVADLFIYLILETLTVGLFRFIQTAHFEKSQFSGNSRIYTMWIFGSYSGKVKEDQPESSPAPPEPPPVPLELKE